MDYLLLKWVHVVSSTILFGTGIGLAFYFFVAHQAKEFSSMRFTTKMVVLGDLIFTTPAGIVQIISGVLLVQTLGMDWLEPWLLLAISLVVFAGACWLPVVWLQIKMRDMTCAVASREELPPQYWTFYKYWVLLGAMAFPALIVVFWLMVTKPDLPFGG